MPRRGGSITGSIHAIWHYPITCLGTLAVIVLGFDRIHWDYHLPVLIATMVVLIPMDLWLDSRVRRNKAGRAK